MLLTINLLIICGSVLFGLYLWMNYNIYTEEIIAENPVHYFNPDFSLSEFPKLTKLTIRRTYKNGRVEIIKKEI